MTMSSDGKQQAGVVRLLQLDEAEQAVIDFYCGGSVPEAISSSVKELLDKMGAKDDAHLNRTALDVGCGMIIGRHVRGSMPSWPSTDIDGHVVGTRPIEEHPTFVRGLNTLVILEIDWGGGPGFSWPEQYRITWVPTHKQWICTVHTDSEELYGFMDFSLGRVGEERNQAIEKSGILIKQHWAIVQREFNQPTYSRIIDDGQYHPKVVDGWSEEIWGGIDGDLE